MKQITALAVLSLTAVGLTAAEPAASTPDQQMKKLVAEIQAQQVLLIENQAKIDARLGSVAEALRVARIFASRGGH